MFSSLRNALKVPPAHDPLGDKDAPGSPVSQLALGLGSVHLTDDLSIPGAFSPGPSTAFQSTSNVTQAEPRSSVVTELSCGIGSLRLKDVTQPSIFEDTQPSAPALEALDSNITAAMLTSSSMNISNHGKLFTSATEFYDHRNSTASHSLQSLDMPSALQGLHAVANAKKPSSPPAFRPGRQFGRRRAPVYSQFNSSPSPSPSSPSPGVGKVEGDEAKELGRLTDKAAELRAQVRDCAFDSLSEELKCKKLDEATTLVNDGLARIAHYEAKWKARAKMAVYRGTDTDSKFSADNSKEKRDFAVQSLKSLHAEICALYAPLLAERPWVIDAEYVYNEDFQYLDQINQVLVLLAAICNMIIGLSTINCEFLIGCAMLCVKLGMSTVGARGSDAFHEFSPSQNEIISDMPSSLSAALKKFGADGRFDLHATCPSCNCTHKARSLPGPNLFDYPPRCTNQIVGEHGVSTCGTELLTRRHDGTVQPKKPYLVSSLPDYLARCLSDETYLRQSVDATDATLHAIRTGEEQTGVQNVFEAEFIKDFKGPDGKLFVDRGDKIRLAFSIHSDFFNPDRVTHRGATKSLGIITCANLALDPSIRYLPEYLFVAAIIPGPCEPSVDEMDHFVRPVIEQFVQAWRPGLKVSRTATSESGAVVEAGILLSVNDLPAARKIAGFQGTASGFICSICRLRGKTGVFNTDHTHWIPRDKDELRSWSVAYRDAQTLDQQKNIVEKYGVRWSSLWLLDYWDPTRMLVIDAMHCVLEGVVHYHCRHVLRLDGSARQTSENGTKYAFDWPWIPYDHDSSPDHIKLDPKHIPKVAKGQDTLCWAIEGDDSLSLNDLWTRLDNGGVLDSLRFVAWSLELSHTLNNIDPIIKTLYIERAKRASKRKDVQEIRFPEGKIAVQKNHFIALLLDWRLKQPRRSSDFVLPTGTPETLAHIRKVIQEAVTPSWVNSVPKNYGDVRAGTIKADEWRILSTVFLPIALITLWGDADGSAPAEDDSETGLLLKALDRTMDLFQATILACRHSMTRSRATAYREHLSRWVDSLRTLFPRAREGRIRPNIHAAGHIYDFLLLFGPVMSWWCFPFERLIGAVQKINTNDHIGGQMEATMIQSLTRTGNIRRWLRRPDCPEAVRQLKVLFDKCFVPVNAVKQDFELKPMKGSRRAYANWDGVKFSPSRTHAGNATIIYRPSPFERPVGGQIQEIRNIETPSGPSVQIHVRPYQRLSKVLYDPFRRYSHLLATTYSSTLREKEDVIGLDDIVAHAARFDYSYGRTVLVNLSRD